MLADVGTAVEAGSDHKRAGPRLHWAWSWPGWPATLVRPRRLRLTALVHHMQEVGLNAVPIVALMGFLIGVVLAFQGATQLRQFGAEVFVVDLIAVSILRELGILLTAIIVAGRSASAFTAAIGSMKMREEIDAMRVLGLDPIELLVLPRLLALVILLPILGLVADLAGLFGGGLMAWIELGISPSQFRTQLLADVGATQALVGLSKAPVFAAIIALVGCQQGLHGQGRRGIAGHADLARGGHRHLSGDRGGCAVFRLLRVLGGVMEGEAVIAIRGLTNRFGTTVVHEDLSLDVMRGEVLGVVGASGSGKSVLLRSIVGLQTPSAGQITMLGTDVLDASAADRAAVSARTGVMFQDGALFSALTVRENVEAPMRERLAVDAATRRGAGRSAHCHGRPAARGGRPVTRRRFRAACASARVWRAPCRSTPRSCFWTNPRRASIRSAPRPSIRC